MFVAEASFDGGVGFVTGEGKRVRHHRQPPPGSVVGFANNGRVVGVPDEGMSRRARDVVFLHIAPGDGGRVRQLLNAGDGQHVIFGQLLKVGEPDAAQRHPQGVVVVSATVEELVGNERRVFAEAFCQRLHDGGFAVFAVALLEQDRGFPVTFPGRCRADVSLEVRPAVVVG